MSDEQKPPFTSEHSVAEQATEFVNEYIASARRCCEKCYANAVQHHAWIASAFEAGHARASEEARKALAQRNGARDYDAEIGDANVYRATIKRLEAKLAASHETITALSRDNESLRSVSLASQAREEGLRRALEFYADEYNWRPFEDKAEAAINFDEGIRARTALAAHGGGDEP